MKKNLKKIFLLITDLSFDQWVYLACFGFAAWLMFSTFSYQDGQIILASKLWSDFGAHIPLVRSFSLGANFPPEYPQFAGQPIRYHYLFYLLVGFLEKLGFNLAWAMNLLSTAGFGLLLVMIYRLARLVSGSDSSEDLSFGSGRVNNFNLSRKAGLLALGLFLFNGSLSFVKFFLKHWTGLARMPEFLLQIIQAKDFASFGPWGGDLVSAFWNWNIYTNQRHLGLSFGLGLWLAWPLLKAVFEPGKKAQVSAGKIILIWTGLILLPFLHQAGYVLAIIFIGLWLIINPNLLKTYGNLYFLGVLYSLPGFFYYLGMSPLRFKFGFLAQEKTPWGILHYWWFNLGLYLPLFLWLLFRLRRHKLKLLLIFSGYFVLANTFLLSADMINNHKLINFFQIGLVILSADWLVKHWAQAQQRWQKVGLGLLIFGLTFSGLIDAFPVINDRQLVVADYQQQPLANWILTETKPAAVFVSNVYLYNPASLVGRKTFLDYGYFAWSLGYDDRARRRWLEQIFASDTDQTRWCGLMKQLEIDYLLLYPGPGNLEQDPDQSWLKQTQEPVFKLKPRSGESLRDTPAIYEVAKICQ